LGERDCPEGVLEARKRKADALEIAKIIMVERGEPNSFVGKCGKFHGRELKK